MMKNCLPLLLWCGAVVVNCYSLYNDTEALVFNPSGTADPDQYLRILHVEETFLIVGARDRFYNVSLSTMEIMQEFEWVPTNTDITFCRSEIEKFKNDCHSYVRSAVKTNDSHFYICASSAKKPMCRELTPGLGDKWTLGRERASNIPQNPLSPIFPWLEIRKLETKDTKTLYIAGHHLLSSSVWRPYFYRRTMIDSEGNEVSGLRSDYSDAIFKIDYPHEKTVEFKGIFETDDYIFLTFTEPALETFDAVATVKSSYSRVARVCKNDMGRGETNRKEDASKFLFATLFKSRMLCGDSEIRTIASQKYFSEEYQGYYANYLNDLADSTTPHLSSIEGADGEEIILAIFNSERNALKMSAICAYKVSDLNKVFDSSPQVDFHANPPASVVQTSRPAARCYNDSRNMSAESRENVNNYLLYNSIKSINNSSLFMSAVNYRMTQMAVDWQVEAVDGNKYDVIFVSTDDGSLVQLVKYANIGETEEKYHIVDERVIFPGKHIREMRLIRDEGGKKHLLLNSLGLVKRVALEKCHFYESCSSCIGLRDPYCSWSPTMLKCVSTTHQVNDKYQNISSGVSEICNTKTEPTKSYGLENIKTAQPTPTPQVASSRQELDRNSQLTISTAGFIAIVVILPMVFGVVFFFIGYIYSKRRFTSQTQHLDHELTKNCNGDTIKSNCDAYQTLPKQSNLQLMNNLNGKAPNPETLSMGERTLTRQKQVYV